MNSLILATCISIIYALMQYIEKKIVNKEPTFDSRAAFKSCAIVFVSCVCGIMIYDQLELDSMSETVSNIKSSVGGANPAVFTDAPGF